MFYPIGQGPLFRVASATSGNVWPEPVRGEGAYYVGREGNRYSGPHQLTLYCAEDPLVAVTEGAFYQALNWQKEIASYRTKEVTYPLRSEHLLWVFRIDPRPILIDMESPLAVNRFAYSPQVLLNPIRVYSGTQAIADDVRTYIPPAGAGQQRPEGLKVPSVRTPHVAGFQPHQLALFVMNIPGSVPFDQRSQAIAKMRIEFEFFTHSPPVSVAYHHPRIHWAAPKFRVTAIPGEPSLSQLPVYAGRPNARTYLLNRWYRIGIVF
jgi:hypothetical protein